MILIPKNLIQTFIILIVVGLFLMPSNIKAQQDTIYYNLKWKETIKDSAAFFRPPVKKEGELYRIEDYFANGQLQMSGLSKYIDKTNWEGKVSWFTIEGKIYQIGNYENNRLNGQFISYLNDKKLVAIYKDNYVMSGAMNRSQGRNSYYMEVKNDTIKEVVYDKNLNGIRYENYKVVNGRRYLSKYFNEKGELIGTLQTFDNGYIKGEEVYYYYAPMRVQQIRYHPFDRFLAETFFYPNGNVRTRFEMEPEYKKTFYKKDGTKLGSVTYTLQNDYLKPESGTEYHFKYNYKNSEDDDIASIRTYENGMLQKEELRYQDGKVKTITTYEDNVKKLQVSFNENGEEFARMTYDNYSQLTGTEVSGNKVATYKNGELIKEINYYNNTKTVFSELSPNEEIYFDKEGGVLGRLEIEYKNKYAKPINGKRFYVGYDNNISSIETYDNGYVKERTVYRSKLMSENDTVEFKSTDYYEDGSFNKVREVNYYSNGSKQSDINLKGFEKISGQYYNNKEELIGTYDYIKEEGILYEFFNESNIIKLIQEKREGKLVSLKRYDYGPYRRYGDVDAVLVEEIDVNCCSKTYTKDGEVFASATYKNGEAWKGTVYNEVSKTLISIKDGIANGIYKMFDYNKSNVLEEGQFVNNKKEGVVKKYNYKGQLESTETYKNDLLSGKAIYYDKDGKQTASLIYKEGRPFEGKKIILAGYNKNPNEEIYKDGLITQRISYDDNGKRVTKYTNGKASETIAYHKNSDKKRLTYTVGNYYINGEVIRYDINGKVQHKALFKNYKLESGVVYINASNTYDNRVAYVILNKEENKLSVTMKGLDDEVIFFAEELLEKGNPSKYINKLNLYIDKLTPQTLY